ncbi:MAG: DUF2062 domain-containing protein [Planctomycetota bacterium]|nr:DUF2062 domain-containing protein [Planctomycetota bacterium]
MFPRQIGKILRGKATPLQIMMACILGSMIGFVPGFMNGPGLMIALVLLLVVLNANLGIALLTASLAKVLSLLIMPMSFQMGRILLDGPTQGLYKSMINAPILALFGFDHYVTTGGMVLGFVSGLVMGFIILTLLKRFRLKMANLESNSEAFKRLTSSFPARTAMFIFIGGGHGKKTYDEMLQKKIGNPIRIMGVVFAVLVVGLLYIVLQFASEPILTSAMKNGLESINGATVDLQSVDLNLKEGRLTITGLALADPNALERDIFKAVQIEADIAGADLLRKRMKLDRVVVSEASSGGTRANPGKHIGPPPEPTPEDEDGWGFNPGEKSIDQYIKGAEIWKQRLAQARQWMEKISGSGVDDDTPDQETLKERLAREIAEKGYARVTASHLIDDAPTMWIAELIAEGVKSEQIKDEVFDIEAQNLSTHPYLVDDSPHVKITSRSGNILFESGLSSKNDPEANKLVLTLKQLKIDDIAKHLSIGGEPPMQGGKMKIQIDGTWSDAGVGYLDLPMLITLRNTTLSLPGVGSSAVERFKLPITLRGPMDNPRITIDDDLLADALVQAGADRLANEVRGEADKLLDDLGEKLGDEASKGIGDALKGLLPGSDKKKNNK